MNKIQFLEIIKQSVRKGYTLHKTVCYMSYNINIHIIYIVIDISGHIHLSFFITQ